MMNYWGNRNSFDWHFFGFLIPLTLLDLVLRGFALWKSARRDQNIWFIALLVVNSVGILPLIYLLLNRDPEKSTKKK